ncbi:hypothetical protein LHYA1_G007727 [Lachnellula hyalina]|uniref:Non-homologous end-joining factor 1 n=1 Tax=Lachnellula hyalina TaxID=1316788 RepID=A0A8H8QWB0_9HELO|nr:uncharacterized protein LHYA1_G007727 [Lachnellula hyalina]TVY24017.1 hypothetical protein LHYA1_G007727 [Lachnellula hyalina]
MVSDERNLIRSREMEEEHGWKSLEDMQEELRYRGLPDTGDKSVLMNRLYTLDEENWGPEGRKLDYERRLKVYREKKLAEIVPFLLFNKFPKDVRLVIWEHSLPGPRTICPGKAPKPLPLSSISDPMSLDGGQPDGDSDPDASAENSTREQGQPVRKKILGRLYFPKSHHTPNPAALAVCRESRYIALQRYKLCFDTPNVYADLDIDILYFGQWMNMNLDTFWTNPQTNLFSFAPVPLHPKVKADLERVQRIGLKYEDGWNGYDGGHSRTRGILTIEQLRKDLSRFIGLKEVFLSHNSEDGGDYSEPGQTMLEYCGSEDHIQPAPYGGYINNGRETNIKTSWYKEETFTPEEKQRGVPEVKFGVVKRVPNIPEFKRTSGSRTSKLPDPVVRGEFGPQPITQPSQRDLWKRREEGVLRDQSNGARTYIICAFRPAEPFSTRISSNPGRQPCDGPFGFSAACFCPPRPCSSKPTATMVWKPLRLSKAASAHLPPFLLSLELTSDPYTIYLTDLTTIWKESLDRAGIIRRSEEEGTSIDPSDDDQFRILLEKIRLGLEGHHNTTSALTINADDDRPMIILNLTVPLPGGLAPLQWPIRLSAAPQSLFTIQLTMPLLGARHVQMQEVKSLGEVLEAKDHVIQKLLDTMESQGMELSQVFPQAAGKAGRKIDRKKAEERVKGLARFDMVTWRQGLYAEKLQDAGQLISEVFEGDTTDGLNIETSATGEQGPENWWESIRGITVNLNTGRISTNGLGKSSPQNKRLSLKPTLQEQPFNENDDFKVQAEPRRLASRAHKSSPQNPPLDDSTDDEDDDLGGPSQVSRIPDSFPKSRSQSQSLSHHYPPASPSPPAPSMPKPKKQLGRIGAKKAAPRPSPPIDEEATTDDSAPSPTRRNAPSPTPEPAPKPKPAKGKLGKIGGKKAAPPPAPEPDPEPAPTTPKSKSKLGKIGGKKKASTPAPDSPEPRIKSSPRSTQEEISLNNTVDGDRGREMANEEKEKTPEPRETSLERADRKRAELKRDLEVKAMQPVKKKRKF